jgi:hypothetical protein
MTATPRQPDYGRYEQYHRALAVSQDRAEAIVAQAQPPAQSLLADPAAHVGPDGQLPIQPRLIPAESARYGYLLPVWPEPDKRPVPLYIVPNYGLMTYLWRRSIGEPASEYALAEERFLSGERIWVGLANDVLQSFVPDPPAGTYRMYRHHALMLFCATTWLPAPARAGWFALYDWGARTAIDRYMLSSLADPISWMDAADQEASAFYSRVGPAVHDDAGVRAFLRDADQVEEYARFSALSNVGIATLALLYQEIPEAERQAWLRKQVNEEHRKAEFLAEAVRTYIRMRS